MKQQRAKAAQKDLPRGLAHCEWDSMHDQAHWLAIAKNSPTGVNIDHKDALDVMWTLQSGAYNEEHWKHIQLKDDDSDDVMELWKAVVNYFDTLPECPYNDQFCDCHQSKSNDNHPWRCLDHEPLP